MRDSRQFASSVLHSPEQNEAISWLVDGPEYAARVQNKEKGMNEKKKKGPV